MFTRKTRDICSSGLTLETSTIFPTNKHFPSWTSKIAFVIPVISLYQTQIVIMTKREYIRNIYFACRHIAIARPIRQAWLRLLVTPKSLTSCIASGGRHSAAEDPISVLTTRMIDSTKCSFLAVDKILKPPNTATKQSSSGSSRSRGNLPQYSHPHRSENMVLAYEAIVQKMARTNGRMIYRTSWVDYKPLRRVAVKIFEDGGESNKNLPGKSWFSKGYAETRSARNVRLERKT